MDPSTQRHGFRVVVDSEELFEKYIVAASIHTDYQRQALGFGRSRYFNGRRTPVSYRNSAALCIHLTVFSVSVAEFRQQKPVCVGADSF